MPVASEPAALAKPGPRKKTPLRDRLVRIEALLERAMDALEGQSPDDLSESEKLSRALTALARCESLVVALRRAASAPKDEESDTARAQILREERRTELLRRFDRLLAASAEEQISSDAER